MHLAMWGVKKNAGLAAVRICVGRSFRQRYLDREPAISPGVPDAGRECGPGETEDYRIGEEGHTMELTKNYGSSPDETDFPLSIARSPAHKRVKGSAV
jgi:hypothetical protein